ncbi:unnamed protein product [Menidia menidia]|uniref:(Atlantic silverside) hypothetical protein n=1 Tax=Menidia menidia TaxID=238744 RepID=A0A8S4BJX4_9TELE|nr:unnamed protein product [Menidia menidia]
MVSAGYGPGCKQTVRPNSFQIHFLLQPLTIDWPFGGTLTSEKKHSGTLSHTSVFPPPSFFFRTPAHVSSIRHCPDVFLISVDERAKHDQQFLSLSPTAGGYITGLWLT